MPTNSVSERVEAVVRQSYHHLVAAADYIWKTPEFLEMQERIEMEKLAGMSNPDHRELRWQYESFLLYTIFPSLMASSNLFIALSLLEVYVLRLAVLCREATGVQWDSIRGQGIQRYMTYLRSLGVNTSASPLWPQVNAALKIRHLVMHASGLLLHSREEEELRRIVRSKTYLSEYHRDADRDAPLVSISETSIGDQLKIDNKYPWLLAGYLRDYLDSIGRLVVLRVSERPTES